MTLLKLFIGFFIANLLGYGGGPASIPLIQNEVVNHYNWMTNAEFVNVLAIGNALPGPIATKIATYVGYMEAGWLGAIVALAATIVPSAVAVVALLALLNKYRQSSVVKGMTLLVQPVIAILMVVLTYQIGSESALTIGIITFFAIAIISLVAMEKFKVHPALVILAAFIYGGFFLK
jgi:chromate transporter